MIKPPPAAQTGRAGAHRPAKPPLKKNKAVTFIYRLIINYARCGSFALAARRRRLAAGLHARAVVLLSVAVAPSASLARLVAARPLVAALWRHVRRARARMGARGARRRVGLEYPDDQPTGASRCSASRIAASAASRAGPLGYDGTWCWRSRGARKLPGRPPCCFAVAALLVLQLVPLPR